MSSNPFLIRDISWLSFNERVLQEAQDPSVSLIDRLRFLGIFSNNLDEFYRVRVATLRRMSVLEKNSKMRLEQNPIGILNQIYKIVENQRKIFDNSFEKINAEMRSAGIFLKTEKELNDTQKEFVNQYFNNEVRTSIAPIMLESVTNMPMLQDKSIYLACVLGNTEFAMMQRYALIEIPRKNIPRFIVLPSPSRQKHIILLEDIIRFCLPLLFEQFGYNTFNGYIIKFTRDAELDIDNDVDANLLEELNKGLKSRKKGKAVRFVYDKEINSSLLTYLINRLNIHIKDNVIPSGKIHNFKDFMNFPNVFRKSNKTKITPFVHPLLVQPKSLLKVLDTRDVMLHFPYHSYNSVIDLIREAAIDPQVEKIKISLYRVADRSKVIHALINAAQNGKEVIVVLELKARFDEENNLHWKTVLEENNIKVLLGIPNMKIHSKLCLIIKNVDGKRKNYAYISTGNFNESTSKIYADHGLMTSNKKIVADIENIFEYLENILSKKLKNGQLIVNSPNQTREFFLNELDNAIKYNSKKKPSSVLLKLNSLVDETLINKIYEAHKKGVEIKLIIRGICTAKTENIKGFNTPLPAISIVDNFLEHARVFIFKYNNEKKYFISSADWMIRNLDHRIETTCPILSEEIMNELDEIYKFQWHDTTKARILNDSQNNTYIESSQKHRSQIEIYNYLRKKRY